MIRGHECSRVACCGLALEVLGVNPGGLGSRPPDFVMRVLPSPLNIIIRYNVEEYEMKTLSKVITFQK